MACNLVSSFSINCRDGNGGATEMKVREFIPALTGTSETSGTVTFSGAALTNWYTYAIEKETASFMDDLVGNVQNGTTVYNETVTYIFNKLQTAFRNELKTLGQKRLWIAIKDSNGTAWLFGYTRGMDLTTANSASGTAWTDRSGYTLTFIGAEPNPIVAIDNYDSLITA